MKNKKLKVVPTNAFKKQYKKAKKQGKDMNKLKAIVEDLVNRKPLKEKQKDHSLVGEFKGFKECHIEPDWLLIYKIEKDMLILTLAYLGSHSDLFD